MNGEQSHVTNRLAPFVAGAQWEVIPPEVRCAGVRGLLNFVGCALGGARDEAVGIAVKGAHAVLRAAARDREQARRAARRA